MQPTRLQSTMLGKRRRASVAGGAAMSSKILRPGQLLSAGSQGPEVKQVQRLLNLFPPTKLAALKLDGIFGEKTRRRVLEFQQSVDLRPDGIVGAASVNALCVTFPEFEALGARYGTVIQGPRRIAYQRQLHATVNGFRPVAAVPGVVVVVGLVIAIIIVFYIAMLNLLPAHQKAHREFAKFIEKKIDELREAMNLPGPVQVMERAIENIRETTKEFIERLKQSRLNCDQSPEALTRCAKQSMAVAVATQNLLHKLGELTFIGTRGFKLDDLVAGILASCAALVKVYSELGKCLNCKDISFLD